jgi:hypothetical protein
MTLKSFPTSGVQRFGKRVERTCRPTEEDKERPRLNAVRHGLTAETVIGVLEDAED